MSAPIFCRAPSHMRYGRESYFKPKFVSIGPLYYKKIKKQKVIEEAKNECISSFLSKLSTIISKPNADINDLIRMIDINETMKSEVRRWYGKSFHLGDEEFFEMLVRDSCFIILIILDFSRGVDESMFYPGVDIKTVRFDLLLLENQIPFFFLNKVYNFLREINMLRPVQSSENSTSNSPSNSPSSSPQGCTCLCCLPIPAQSHISQSTQTPNQRQSQLPLYPLSQEQSQSSRSLLQSTPQQSQSHTPQSTPEQTTNFIDEFLEELKPFIWLDMPWKFYDHDGLTEPTHLLDLYWKWCTPSPSNGPSIINAPNQPDLSSHTSNDQSINLLNQHDLEIDCWHFPYDNDAARRWEKIHLRSNAPKRIKNADVLYQRAGATFQKREHSEGFDVTFQNGILQIPHLQLDPKQATLLANLVAFEELLNKPSKERLLTSYVLLLDGLINTEKDVELLQRYGIMTNKLGNSQKAYTYFNDIGNVCTVDYEDHYCKKQFDDLNSYYHSKWNNRFAKLRHEYFHSPWAVISLFAGVYLLSLSTIQTYYSISRYYQHH
ncbi:UPF0481 protein At3g47200-like [Carex rostrata]